MMNRPDRTTTLDTGPEARLEQEWTIRRPLLRRLGRIRIGLNRKVIGLQGRIQIRIRDGVDSNLVETDSIACSLGGLDQVLRSLGIP